MFGVVQTRNGDTENMSLSLNEIICGDCLDIMETFPEQSVDAIVTDPPYAFAGGISNSRTSEMNDQFFFHWWKAVCKQLNRIMKDAGEGFIWCDWRSAMTIARGFEQNQKYGLRLAQMLYHYREMPGNGSPFRSSVDMIGYVRGWKSDGHRILNTTHNLISKYWYYGKHKYHPTEKDVEIAKKLIEWCSDEKDIVLDPFCGSGSVCLAAKELNRKWIGIDINPEYCKIAQKRTDSISKRLNSFADTEVVLNGRVRV